MLIKTPYGNAIRPETLAPGVTRYHGVPRHPHVVLRLDPDANRIPPPWHRADGWYSGSAFLAMVTVIHADHFAVERVRDSHDLLLRRWPPVWEALYRRRAVEAAAATDFRLAQAVRATMDCRHEWLEARHWDASDPRVDPERVVVKCYCPLHPEWGYGYFSLSAAGYAERRERCGGMFVADMTADQQLDVFDILS